MDDSNRPADERSEEANAARLRALFSEVLERPKSDHADFIRKVRADEPALAEPLERLLLKHQVTIQDPTAAVTTFESGSGPGSSDHSTTYLGNGDTIGSFKIRELLGESGCGEVYLAQQTEPVRRRVALKIITLGMDSWSVLGNDHPNTLATLNALLELYDELDAANPELEYVQKSGGLRQAFPTEPAPDAATKDRGT